MSEPIDRLEVEIESSATSAVSGIDALTATLGKLKGALKGGVGLTSVSKQLTTLNTALNGVSQANTETLNKLSQSLHTLSSLGNLKLSSSIAAQITSLGTAVRSLDGANFGVLESLSRALTPLATMSKANLNTFISQLQRLPGAIQALDSANITGLGTQVSQLVAALKPLSEMGKNNLTSFITQLSKIPKLMQDLKSVDMRTLYNQIQSLTRVFTPLATQMQAITAGFASFPHRIQRLIQTTDNLSTSNNRASKSYVNLAAKIGIAYVVMNRIARVMANMMNQAIQWDGIAQRFSRSFGEYAQDAYSWVKRLNEEIYINTQQFMQYSSIFASMLKGYGIAQKDAAAMAVGYTELAYDIWAGYNDVYASFNDAATAVRATIAGEVEQIRRAGFTIVDSQLALTAANHGVAYSTQSATEEMKSYLRYLTLVDQAKTQNLIGTYAREMNTAEGLIRTLKQQLISLAQVFGSVFLPILAKVLPYVQAFVQLITEAIRAVATLFEVDIQPIDFGAGLGAIGESAVVAGDLEDNLGGAGKEAKKLKDYLLGIDELNVMSPPDDSDSGGSGIGGGIGSGGGLDVGSLWDESIFAEVNKQVSEIVGKIKEWLGLTEEIDTWSEFFHTRLGRILTTIGAIALGLAAWKISRSVLDGLAYISTLKKAGLGKAFTISAGISLAVTGIALEAAGIIDALQNELNGMNFTQIIGGGGITMAGGALVGKGIAGAVGAALGAGIGGVIAGIPAMFVGIYDACVNGIDWLNAILIPAGGAAAGFGVAAILTAAGTAVAPGVGTLIGLAVGLVIDGIILVIQYWDEITAFLKNFFTVTVPGIWNDFVTWLSKIPKALGKFFSSLPGKISDWFDNLWKPIKDYDWNGLGYNIGQWFGNAVKSAIEFVTVTIPNWFSKMWESIKSAFKQFFTVTLPNFFTETIPMVVEKIGSFFKELPEKIYNAFISAKDWFVDIGSAIIDGIWEGLQSIWKAITDFVDGFVQGFKDALGIHSPSTVFAEIGINIIDGLFNGIKTIGNAIATWFDTTVVRPVHDLFHKLVINIREFFSNGWTWVKNVWSVVTNWFNVNVTRPVYDLFNTLLIRVREFFSNAWNLIKTVWSAVTNWFDVNVVRPVYNLFQSLLVNIQQFFSNAWSNIKAVWSAVTNWFTVNVSRPVYDTFQSLLSNVQQFFSNAWSNIKGIWSAVSNWFRTNVVDPVKNTFSTLTSSIGGIFTDILSGIKNAFSGLANWFKTNVTEPIGNFFTNAMNSVIRAINSMIRAINRVSFDVPDWVPGIGGETWGFDIPQIPLLASGGFVNSGQMFVARENGLAEMVGAFGNRTAVANNDQIVAGISGGVFNAVRAAMSGANMALTVDSSALQYYNSESLAKAVSSSVSANSTVATDGLQEEFKTALLEVLKESGLAEDVRRQADKNEQTVVQVGNRTITDAVVTQQNANGYRFVTT